MRFDEKGNPILTREEQKKLFDAERKKDIGGLLLDILNELKGLREDLKRGKKWYFIIFFVFCIDTK